MTIGPRKIPQASQDRAARPVDRAGVVRVGTAGESVEASPARGVLASLSGATGWVNSAPLTAEG